MTNNIYKQFGEFLDKNYPYNKRDKSKNLFTFEIYTDYNDYLDESIIKEIFTQPNPREYLDEKIYDWYWETEARIKDDLYEEFCKEIGIVGIDDDEWNGLLDEYVEVEYPFDFFYGQKVQVNIFVDTGDGNYDFVLNAHYPHYNGVKGEKFDQKASLVWLAKQQGYTKKQLQDFVNENADFHDPKGFLESVTVELANMCSSMPRLTFLTEMTIEECCDLQEALVKRIRNDDDKYDATKRPNVGYIVLDKTTECGLYDNWNGGGSVLEIQLEKDVKLPLKYIRSALPDGCDGYSIAECYGICKSFWKDKIKIRKY